MEIAMFPNDDQKRSREARGTGLTLSQMVELAHRCSFDHGWWEAQTFTVKDEENARAVFLDCIEAGKLAPASVIATIPEKLMLIVTEVAEAMECYRDPNHAITQAWEGEGGKPEGLPAELADVVIRVGDLCGALGIDLEAAVLSKMAHNDRRPHRHGGKRA